MKTGFIYCVIVFFLSLAISSCECVNTTCGDPPRFTIIDKNTKADLTTGANPRYPPDSIFTIKIGDTTFTKVEYDTPAAGPRFYLPRGDTVFLRLGNSGIDTLLVTYITEGKKSKCCPHGLSHASTLLMDGIYLRMDGEIFFIEK